ncbi:MAG TPA: bifunctional ornithine acetyltransferase/N-acetylglutamate synthase [Paracoccus sp. (in: a-proteobacteria)]|nr:bifunctional ornithine acetyltransferase/N-acetylglutamate synthase [Paracoccus sp. (in: a-proteobacteria)]
MVDGQLQDLAPDLSALTPLPPGAVCRAVVDRLVKGQGGVFVRLPEGERGFLRGAHGLSEGQSLIVQVTGAATAADARKIANTIATSPLVKTAFAGGDPNWGRIMMATGRSGVELRQDRLALWIAAPDGDPLAIVRNGTPTDYRESDAAAVFALPEFIVHVDLGAGTGEATIWTTDLTHDYVTINADYRT